ncbi:MAG: hypothetical protein ACXWTR_02560 [Methylotenera sp.]
MDIFNSQWLINMLAKSSKTPQGRILSLFDILDDWLDAPNVYVPSLHKGSTQAASPNQLLIAFCTIQAKACGAENPAILAQHIVLIARNAAQQAMDHPGGGSLGHAKKAANALILAQTQKGWSVSTLAISKLAISKPTIYGIAASLFLLVGSATIWLPVLIPNNQHQAHIAKINIGNEKTGIAPNAADKGLTAHDAAIMYAKYEQMRNGTCQFPEVLAIPDKDKAIYLENVVGGKLPTDLKNLAIANFYLGKVRCNFTPMLMARST